MYSACPLTQGVVCVWTGRNRTEASGNHLNKLFALHDRLHELVLAKQAKKPGQGGPSQVRQPMKATRFVTLVPHDIGHTFVNQDVVAQRSSC
jgi:hypothetical protein